MKTQEDLFEDPEFQKSMSEHGIIIPKALQKEFGEKSRVYWGEPEFFKAFKELYFDLEMDPNLYEWR